MYVHRLQVQFVETDMAGIVHFSNFFRYMEAAEDALLRILGIELVGTHAGKPMSFIRMSAHCDYSHPLRYPDTVDIAVRIDEIRTRAVRYRFDFRVGTTHCAVGKIVAVCCHKEKQWKAIPIPDEMLQKFVRYRDMDAGNPPTGD